MQLLLWPLEKAYSLSVIIGHICLQEQMPHRHVLGRRAVFLVHSLNFFIEQLRFYFQCGFGLSSVHGIYKSNALVQSNTARRISTNSRNHPSTLHSSSRGERWWFWVLERKLNNDSLYWQTRENRYHMSEKVISLQAFTWVVSFFLSENRQCFHLWTILWEILITFGWISLLNQTSR